MTEKGRYGRSLKGNEGGGGAPETVSLGCLGKAENGESPRQQEGSRAGSPCLAEILLRSPDSFLLTPMGALNTLIKPLQLRLYTYLI